MSRRPRHARPRRVAHPHRAVRACAGTDARHRLRHPRGRRTLPPGSTGTGPTIEFARSNLNVRWSDDFVSLLDLAEACDVPVRWSCRTGVCHTCETTVIAGEPDYDPTPVEPSRRRKRARSSAARDRAATLCSICDQPRRAPPRRWVGLGSSRLPRRRIGDSRHSHLQPLRRDL